MPNYSIGINKKALVLLFRVKSLHDCDCCPLAVRQVALAKYHGKTEMTAEKIVDLFFSNALRRTNPQQINCRIVS